MTDEERAKEIWEECREEYYDLHNAGGNPSGIIAEALRAERQRTLESEVVKNLTDSLRCQQGNTCTTCGKCLGCVAVAAYDAALKKGDL